MLGYSPAQGDLAYPERLLMMKDIKAQSSEGQVKEQQKVDKNSENSAILASVKKRPFLNLQSSAIDLHCLWYPTVRRTIMCLSKLHKCLEVVNSNSL